MNEKKDDVGEKLKKNFNNQPKRAYPHIAHAKKSSHSLVFVTTTSIKVN